MRIEKRTLFYSAAQEVKCTKEQAFAFHSRLIEINWDRASAQKSPHTAEQCLWGGDGMLIAGIDFHTDNLADDLCHAIADLLDAAGVDHLDITYCVCTPIFHTGSHWGGYARIYRGGKVKQTRFLDTPPH